MSVESPDTFLEGWGGKELPPSFHAYAVRLHRAYEGQRLLIETTGGLDKLMPFLEWALAQATPHVAPQPESAAKPIAEPCQRLGCRFDVAQSLLDRAKERGELTEAERAFPADAPKEKHSEELPGMLAVAKAVHEQRWPHTMDAKVWADEFAKVFPDIEQGTMLAWFANAIMAGYDTAQARSERLSRELDEALVVGTKLAAQSAKQESERGKK